MSFIFGFIIILFGFSIILNAIFQIHIPVFKIVFSLFLIYLGAKILFGAFGIKSSEHTAIFSKSDFAPTSRTNQYNVVFGEGEIDLTGIDIEKGNVEINVNTVFGECRLKIPKNTPTIIKANTILGAARLPGKNLTALGKTEYKTTNYSPIKNKLVIRADVVFGEFRVNFVEDLEKKESEDAI